MNGTPVTDPPVVLHGDARLLLHEDAIGAILHGLRIAHPKLFVFGSFDVPLGEVRPPISIPTPHNAPPVIVNYRVDISEVHVDLPPASADYHSFPNPHVLQNQEAALFSRIIIDLAGDPPSTWREQFALLVWMHTALTSLTDEGIIFRLLRVALRIVNVQDLGILNACTHILNQYLASAVVAVRVPIGRVMNSKVFGATLDDIALQLNAGDVQVSISR
ncbi:MAG TPA: hypothetical protein VJZ71_17535 [Phycisphaerae bacterium]|nr:hypothetical protein [Phycisphaerae bacterium]